MICKSPNLYFIVHKLSSCLIIFPICAVAVGIKFVSTANIFSVNCSVHDPLQLNHISMLIYILLTWGLFQKKMCCLVPCNAR